jgi:hypothetical protein
MQACRIDRRLFRFVTAAILLAVFGFTLGCSSGELPVAPAHGKVTYKGKPLEFGTVMFEPKQGPPATGQIQPDGTFVLGTYGSGDGAIVGSHTVRIACNETQRPGYKPPVGEEPGAGKSLIPEKYGQPSLSQLTAEVTADGPNEFPFDLKD